MYKMTVALGSWRRGVVNLLHYGFEMWYNGIMWYVLIALSIVIIFLAAYFMWAQRFEGGRQILYKIAALILIAVFAVRYMSAPNAYTAIISLEDKRASTTDGLIALSPFLVVVCSMAIWLGLIAVITLAMSPFFRIRIVSVFVMVIVLPSTILMLALSPFTVAMLEPDIAKNALTLKTVLYSVEIGLCLFLALVHSLEENHKAAITRRELGLVLLLLLPAMMLTMPIHFPTVFFGEATKRKLVEINFYHRLLIYGAFVVPCALYFLLRKHPRNVKRYVLTFVAVSTMISFTTLYPFSSFLNPVTMPLHLCNTAMYLVPICLIFRTKRLFYFTYFINVLGAFLAILMPNYELLPLNSPYIINFWINHYIAFFLPFLSVALGEFKRPSIREFRYSMTAFAIYFVGVLFLNAWFSNYGNVDFFFLNSDFIVSKFPKEWSKIMNITAEFDIKELHFKFYPIFQLAFFLGYVVMALGVWFLYDLLYKTFCSLSRLHEMKRKIKQDEIMLLQTSGKSSFDKPIDEEGANMMKLINFSKRYSSSRTFAVDNVNLEVNAGEIFGFLGPNGAGKSTIIKSLVGLQPITSGRIEVCGYDVEKQSIQAKQMIGFVPDHYALYEKLTGREYINYIADIYGVKSAEREERINHFLNIFEIRHAFDSQIKTYSHGMKQKIAIIAALVHNPKVWILDEPLTGLDPNSIYQVKETMKEHAKNGNIVFFSSHIMDVVERLCHRIAIIKKGKILVNLTIEEIEKSGQSLEAFYLDTIANC